MDMLLSNSPLNNEVKVTDLHEKPSDPKQVKVTISDRVVCNLDRICTVQDMSRAQIIEASINDYLNRSFNWQTRRFFFEKSEKTFSFEDLKKFTSRTRVFVVCSQDKDSSYKEWLCAYITSVNKDGTITIQPSHPVNPFPAEYVLSIDEEDNLVIPKVVDWNPTISTAPYWQHYRFTIEAKYIWYVTTENF